MSFDVPPAVPAWYIPGGELDVRLELKAGGTWTDFTSRVFDAGSGTIQRGHPDESTTAAPSSFSSTINNNDGVLSYLNPSSPYYGQLGLNTPLRVSIPDASPHMRLERDQASGAKTTAHPSVGSGGFEVWADVSLDNWYTPQVIAAQWASSTNNRSWLLNAPGDGSFQLIVSADGTTSTQRFFGGGKVPIVHGRVSVRVRVDVIAGTVFLYTGQYCANWVQVASTPVTGGLIAPFNGTAPVEIGMCTDQTDWPEIGCNGKVYAFAYINGVNVDATHAVASTDFTALTPGVTSWSDAQSNSWALEGTSEIANRDYRFHGEAAAWPQSWTPGDPNARVALSAGGLLRRYGQTNTSLQSAMFRAYTRASTALEYWPFEDGSNATQVASGNGGGAFHWGATAPELSSFSGFACSGPVVTLNQATLTAAVRSYTLATSPGANADAILRMLMAVPSSGDNAGAVIARMTFRNPSKIAYADLSYQSGGALELVGYDFNGASLFSTGLVGFNVNGELLRVSVELRNTGTNQYSASITTLQPGSSTGLTFSVTGLTGKLGPVQRIIFNPSPAPFVQGTAVGHVSLESTWTSLFNMGPALAAYAGEAAGVRFKRLCGEDGIQFRGVGKIEDTTPMGVQSIETLPSLLQECVDADRGMWFEPRQVLGWGYRTRVSLGNQVSKVGFDYSLDQLSDTLDPTIDDQVIKNDVTVTNQGGGSSSRQVLDDGTARSVGKIGRYDTEMTVNLGSDSLLDSEASWVLHTLTVDEPRYTAINCDLANTAVAPLYWQILESDMGDRITVRNPPVWLPPGLVDQLAQGVTETVSRKGLSESWNGVPSTPWNVAYADDVVFGRADTDGSTLASAVTAGTPATVWGQGRGWGSWAASFASTSLSGDSLVVTASGTGTSFWQAFGPSLPVSSGQTVSIVATVRAGSQALSSVSAGIHLSGSSDTFTASPGVPLAPGASATVVVSATAVSGQTAWGAYVVDSEASPSGASMTVDVVYGGVTGVLSVGTSTSGSPLWTTSTADFPFDVAVGGERVTVAKVTGAASPQAFTAIRSVNGVAKAQSSGTDVRLWSPSIISL